MSKAIEYIKESARYKDLAYNRGLMAPRPRYSPSYNSNKLSEVAENNIHQAIQLINESAKILTSDGQNYKVAIHLKAMANELLNIYQTLV